jgi:hypothetical protein
LAAKTAFSMVKALFLFFTITIQAEDLVRAYVYDAGVPFMSLRGAAARDFPRQRKVKFPVLTAAARSL